MKGLGTPDWLAISAVLISLTGLRAYAQTCQNGELRVLVRDSQGSPIYDAQVRVGSAGREIGTRATPSMGVADFKDVPCGAWTVRASKTGFEDKTVNVQIAGESVVEIGVTLNPQINRSGIDV